MLSVEINGNKYKVKEGSTIIEACKQNGIYIPTLCYHPDLPPAGACGLCVVKVDGNSFAYSCMTKIVDGMSIETKSKDVVERVKTALGQFIDFSLPPPSKDIEQIYQYLFNKNPVQTRAYEKTNAMVFHPEFCINCDRCVRVCEDVQRIGALNEPNPRMRDNECIHCGQCILVCPTNALEDNKSQAFFLRALSQGKITVLQTERSAAEKLSLQRVCSASNTSSTRTSLQI